jgi:hypothetical protein
MLRRKTILTTAAVMAVCAAPASATTYDDLRSPDAKDAAREAGAVTGPSQDLRSPDAQDAARQAGAVTETGQDLRSPDAQDAAASRGLYESGRGPYVLDRGYGSPDAADVARDLPPVRISAPVVQASAPSGGFDWGDAGIGAAGMLGLFSIAAGSVLLMTGRRRRGALRAVTH